MATAHEHRFTGSLGSPLVTCDCGAELIAGVDRDAGRVTFTILPADSPFTTNALTRAGAGPDSKEVAHGD